MDLKLQVIGIPVSDVDAARAFSVEQVGFGLDHDVAPAPGMRVVQMTPPGSACSVVTPRAWTSWAAWPAHCYARTFAWSPT